MIVAHISDMHIRLRGHILHHIPQVAQPLRRVLTAISQLRPAPDCIVATGDLTEAGRPAEYARLREILNDHPGVPIYLLPGNHDRSASLQSVFSDQPYLRGSPCGVLFTIEGESLRIIALDSSHDASSGGYFSEARLEWLRLRLHERRSTATILAMHHPPFPTGIAPVDRQAFQGREEIGRIIAMHPQIARIICGHVHQPLARRWHGALCVTAPSTAPTLALHASARGLSWDPGGFLVHRYERSTGLTTALIRIAAEPVALTA